MSNITKAAQKDWDEIDRKKLQQRIEELEADLSTRISVKEELNLRKENKRLKNAIEREIRSYGPDWGNTSMVRVKYVIEGLQRALKGGE